MRILFVAFPSSIHSARWINQVTDQGWDLHLAPSVLQPLNLALRGKVKLHGNLNQYVISAKRSASEIFAHWPHPRGSGYAQRLREQLQKGVTAQALERVIRRIKPDIVHSLEMQRAGYLTLSTKDRMGSDFPTWVMSNWGSDVYLYHRIAAHRERVKEALVQCDFYACECQRDVELAQELGLQGRPLPVLPVAGGFDLERCRPLRQPGPTSARKVILLKGYQHWAGRALTGLRAIELCADVIRERGYSVLIHLASPDVPLAAELVSHATGIPIEVIPHVDHIDSLRRFGVARIHMGLSISDGISQSLLESMVMGAFPIQSCTACANEWIEDGKSGFLVPPEDPEVIAVALRRAVIDDDFVDQAAKINEETVRQRLSYGHVKAQVIDMYKSVFATSRGQKHHLETV